MPDSVVHGCKLQLGIRLAKCKVCVYNLLSGMSSTQNINRYLQTNIPLIESISMDDHWLRGVCP